MQDSPSEGCHNDYRQTSVHIRFWYENTNKLGLGILINMPHFLLVVGGGIHDIKACASVPGTKIITNRLVLGYY